MRHVYVNIGALVLAGIFFGAAFGWKVGVAVVCLAYFMKNPE